MAVLLTNGFHQFEDKENENADANNGDEKGKTTDKHENVVEEIVSGCFELAIVSLIVKRVPLLFNSLLWAQSTISNHITIFINLLGLFGFSRCFQLVLFSVTKVNLVLISMVNSYFKLDVSECCKLSGTS